MLAGDLYGTKHFNSDILVSLYYDTSVSIFQNGVVNSPSNDFLIYLYMFRFDYESIYFNNVVNKLGVLNYSIIKRIN